MPHPDEATPYRTVVEALGQLTIGFASLEYALAGLVWVLIGSSQRVGQTVTAELSFQNLVNIFCSLQRSKLSDPAEVRSLKSIRKRLHDAEARRNKYVHSTWMTSVDDGSFVAMKTTAKAKAGLKFQYDHKAAPGVNALTRDIAALTKELQLLIVKLIKEPPPTGQDSSG